MRVDLVVVWSAAVALSLPAISTADPLFVMSAPNPIRVGTPEKVFVEAQDYAGGPLEVMIKVMKYPKKTTELTSKSVTLTQANQYMLLADITIPKGAEHFEEDGSVNQYVYLIAQFPGKVMERVVLVSFQSGYIFVQTDKTIYTPSSTVFYRIFTVDPTMYPAESGISLVIVTPDGMTIDRNVFYPRGGMSSADYRLPKVVSFGTWKVLTRFIGMPQRNFTAEFEVKEYVLPSFEVSLTTGKTFFYVDDAEMTVDIVARYSYGKYVSGFSFVTFGVMTRENQKRTLPGSLQRVEISEGRGKAILKRENITQTFPNINELADSTIYVSASVQTETGSEMVEAHKKGIPIVTSPYTIHFKRTPKFFKPGMPFDVTVCVTYPDNTPAEGVYVEVVCSSQSITEITRKNGMARLTFNTEPGVTKLPIAASTKDPDLSDARQARQSMTVFPYKTTAGSNNYLHISISDTELRIGDQVRATLIMTRSPGAQNQDLTYLILNKGQLMQANRLRIQRQAMETISLLVTKDMVPSFRIVAYYHVGSSEIVSDSVWVDVKDTCMGTLKVEPSGPVQVYSPRRPFSLSITGDPGARVGLVAVDKGVYVLNNKHRLTQTKIWDVIEKYDIGCTAGSGKNSMGVFYDAGLIFQSSTAGGTETRQASTCPVPAQRRRRSTTIQDQSSSLSDDDAFFFDSDDIVSRSQFQESWLWMNDELPECPKGDANCATTELTERSFLKDSITSWVVTAISISQTHGICVADPYEMVVKKDFFIDLKLPYSAVHNQQIEIMAILYNYCDIKIKVGVELIGNMDVCSVAYKKWKYRTTIEIDPMTSWVVPYVIMPMKLGWHTVEFKAAVNNSHLADGVRKDFLVVSEGVRTAKSVMDIVLNPKASGGEQLLHGQRVIPRNQVPNTPAITYFTLSEINQTFEKAIAGDSMGSLIVEPSGNGEDNMITMTLPLIATHYLDNTKQWEKDGPEKRATAVEYIKKGYQQELVFCKSDGSFAQGINIPSSVWLTAYVAKVFSMARDIIGINDKVICDALKWLIIYSQQPDGVFRERFNVHRGEMVGNVRGNDADASMTAFVLIAMQESRWQCLERVASLPGSMYKATNYLEVRLNTLTNPYAVAMVSYALANEGKLNPEILFKLSTGNTHWEVAGNKQFSLEATAYALLALVRAGEFDKAVPIVHWLKQQQFYGGGYGSTQSTIMVFQAVAEYVSQTKQQDMNLEIEISTSGKSRPTIWIFNKRNAFTRMKTDLNQNITVKVRGTGRATLSVMTMYYAKPSEIQMDCNMFHLDVTLVQQIEGTYPGAKESYLLSIDMRYLSKDQPASMSILDIGLLTGFIVDESDLTQLSTGVDRHIQKFEMDKISSEKGSLKIYLGQVSNDRADKISFRIHKMVNVGVLQPGSVTVYEYHNMDNRCTRVYQPVIAGELQRICYKNNCKCLQGEPCCTKKTGDLSGDQRLEKACEAGTDYVYKVTMTKMELIHHTDVYHLTVDKVIKEGSDFGVEGKSREFIAHPNCWASMGLVEGKSYLVMGHKEDVKQLIHLDGSFHYVLSWRTWIEYWPTDIEGQTEDFKSTYAAIQEFAWGLSMFGCQL